MITKVFFIHFDTDFPHIIFSNWQQTSFLASCYRYRSCDEVNVTKSPGKIKSPLLSAFMSPLQTHNDTITRVLFSVLGGCFFGER